MESYTTQELGKLLGVPAGSQQARDIQRLIERHRLPYYKKARNDWREI